MSTTGAVIFERVNGLIDRLLRISLSRNVAVFLAAAAVASCVATYFVLARREGSIDTVYWLLNLDLVLLLLLGAVVGRQVAKLWSERRRGVAGSRLHLRLVFVFSLLAAVPAVLMAVFSSIFLYFGVQAWFNDRVSTAVHESLEVAQSYLREHQQVMRADVEAMVSDLNREAFFLEANPEKLAQIVQTQSSLRNLPEAVVIRGDGEILARSRLSMALELERVSPEMLQQSDSDVVLMTGGTRDRIRALVKLDGFSDAYLYVGRFVDSNVLRHMDTAEKAVREYTTLDGRKSKVQLATTVMFMAVALLLLFAAGWFGLSFSEQLVAPIGTLIAAAERVRSGDLSARVPLADTGDEIELLGKSFNRMTSQLKSQKEELLEANRMLDERRRFTEAVLSGASSGVLGLAADGTITLANSRAEEVLLGAPNGETVVGRNIDNFMPQATEILRRALASEEKVPSLQLDYAAAEGPRRAILLRFTAEQGGTGGVATIDDITALVSAQRSAAWADVARRIAHEIKNPLTPIQLSAERLRRKYLPQIQDDPETFSKCTETIIRQVNDIGHMVSEFSAYARMPVSVKKSENVVDICQDALILQKQAHPDITFGFISAEPALIANCDRSQLTQVITNLLQNAIDSIQERQQQMPGAGHLRMAIETRNDNVMISVVDNGTGLPDKMREQLLEPYVTTKKKGSGLGLAIAKKIMEDHEGSITLENHTDEALKTGAKAVIVFPRNV